MPALGARPDTSLTHSGQPSSLNFAILFHSMAPDTPTSKPSPRDRRAYFRVNTVLPISIQAETDTTEGECIEKSVNISGGGMSVTVNVAYRPDDVLSITLILPDQLIFKIYAEVLWLDPLPYHAGTYRLHTRFVRMTTQNQELLIRHILGFQRSRLENHYSA
jgi:c-di-GMP-binding flagellar brake protein YcgR